MGNTTLIGGHQSGALSLLYDKGYKLPQPVFAHGGAIVQLVSSQHFDQSFDDARATIASYGVDKILQTWLLSMEKETREKHTLMKLMTISMSFIPSCIGINSSCLAITFCNKVYTYNLPSGINTDNGTNYCKVTSDEPMTNQSEDSHTSKITSISVHQTLNLIATSTEDGEIKVWDRSCDLVADITMKSIVNTVCFMPIEPNLLIGSQGHLSIIPSKTIFPYKRFTEELDQSEQLIYFNPELQFWYV